MKVSSSCLRAKPRRSLRELRDPSSDGGREEREEREEELEKPERDEESRIHHPKNGHPSLRPGVELEGTEVVAV